MKRSWFAIASGATSSAVRVASPYLNRDEGNRILGHRLILFTSALSKEYNRYRAGMSVPTAQLSCHSGGVCVHHMLRPDTPSRAHKIRVLRPR